jgi:amino acid transporter
MPVTDALFGRPLATSEERAEQVGPSAGIGIFGLDALSSAAYGPEAALTLLIPLGLLGVHYIVPVVAAILALLTIVYFSYRQTIDAYPHGGGSFTVASENLGDGAGLLAAAALMIDYVLTAAVGISAGVGALISAAPRLQPHTLAICLGILAVLALVNMRGLHETGTVFMLPTYLFLATLFIVIAVGVARVLMSGGHPVPIVPAPAPSKAVAVFSLWLLLKVFASGCTAMTGVEAVSNGVMAFREPKQKVAKRTLTIIIVLLMVLLAGIAYLCSAYGIGATNPDSPGYESVLSQLTGAVMGKGVFYYITIAGILLVLALSANTAFADFPRVTRAIALRDYLPHVFMVRGRRLLYSHGIYALVGLTALLLILFRGVTDRLIPLYAIGAFLAFTLSQAGMVMHWRREKGAGHTWHMLVNGVGAVATGLTLIVVLVAKFTEGAWITALLIPLMIALMVSVKKYYRHVEQQIECDHPLDLTNMMKPLVILPLDRWSRVTEKGLRFAMKLSDQVHVFHVDCEGNDTISRQMWQEKIAAPIAAAGLPMPELVTATSPYRFVIAPILDYVLKTENQYPNRQIAVLVPEVVVSHWWQTPLHNHRAQALKFLLLLKGNRRIIVINVPWYLDK